MQGTKCTAIVLAGGQGKRMGTSVQKQYLEIEGKPILYYTLRAFQDSEIIDEIVLVVGINQEEYCKQEIVDKYQISKVCHIVVGGAERYHSVWSGLSAVKDGYVFIHDGARPFVSDAIIRRAYDAVKVHGACVSAMPVKDTIKIADADEFAECTPDRSKVWMVQTPQVFACDLIKEAYSKLMENEIAGITDDAMVVEKILGRRVKLVLGAYENIKITTPEDLDVAGVFLRK